MTRPTEDELAALVAGGEMCVDISRRLKLPYRWVVDRVVSAVDRQIRLKATYQPGPPLIPLFPIGQFTPQSACPHHGPIRRGSAFVCMVCHGSGRDGPRFAETRRQRRRRLHGNLHHLPRVRFVS